MGILDLNSDRILALGIADEDLERLRELALFFSLDRSHVGREISLEYARVSLKIIESILSRAEEVSAYEGLPADVYCGLARIQSKFIRGRMKLLKVIEINLAARQRTYPRGAADLGE